MSISEAHPDDVQLLATAPPGTEIFVIDHGFRLRARGIGGVAQALEPGLYKVKFRSGSAIHEMHQALEPGAGTVIVTAPPLLFSSAAPLADTAKSHEYHQDAAAALSREVHARVGYGSEVFVFARAWSPTGTSPRGNPARALQLLDLGGAPLIELETRSRTNLAAADPWAGCTVQVTPGAYRLRLDAAPWGRLEQLVVAAPHWQTQVFVLGAEDPRDDAPPWHVDLARATVLQSRLGRGFDPAHDQQRLTDLARLALVNGRSVVPAQELVDMLGGPEADPMLGILAGHALVLAGAANADLLADVVTRLRALLGRHPDVEALALITPVADPAYRFTIPPMLTASWRLVVDASSRRPDVVPAGSLAACVSPALWGNGPWLQWQTEEMLQPGDSSADGAGLAEVAARIADAGARLEPERWRELVDEELGDLEEALLVRLAGPPPTRHEGRGQLRSRPPHAPASMPSATSAPGGPAARGADIAAGLGMPAGALGAVADRLLSRLEHLAPDAPDRASMAPGGPVTDIARRRLGSFVLWRPGRTDPPPTLVIGRPASGNPPTLDDMTFHPLTPDPAIPDLWQVTAAACNLTEGTVYHYWFQVGDTRPGRPGFTVWRTDPLASTVDWRLLSPPLPPPYTQDDRWPASVIKLRGGLLVECDPGGEEPDWSRDGGLLALPANNRTVYYKLPSRWARGSPEGGIEVAAGTFQDVLALVDADAAPGTFRGVAALAPGRAHLVDLGVTTLELAPVADSWVTRDWGYATSNYFAPDHDLGCPPQSSSPTSSRDFARLVTACHRHGIRVGYDAVMAFGQRDPYSEINFLDFHVQWGSGDPEQSDRDGFGGDLWKYGWRTRGYDPIEGRITEVEPARRFMLAHAARWAHENRMDSIRIDSVNNVRNLDFIAEFTRFARELARDRAVAAGLPVSAADERFLVVGEELSVPVALVREGRLDALWNERFKHAIRSAILGETGEGDDDFERTVRKLVDCRELGFADGAQAVNYVTSHDVEGYRNERLYDFLVNNGVGRTEERIKLAFVCLLTAVGIPMILAGEEFADQHDLPIASAKQVDPVNFDRLSEEWRQRVFRHVSRLVRLRQTSEALSVNDTEFIHVDLTAGRRVFAWRRGAPGQRPVVTVANFSDWGTPEPQDPRSEYVIGNWPLTPSGELWREVTQDRAVPPEWVGREPLYPWEAKVYALT
ncbi:1,4-alpha-glucan branching enzyme [Geodermatophilus amargosae]|uniref:1,4-alpha-glucan branching enzyme n=2 Tax=Geodermatophilus amargosae TaxID=1296565 RepID=A0A1I7CGQ4_9ACTN|nr:1,4-alpha-glucan branching enzyme [Geodermatophilus amargosae]